MRWDYFYVFVIISGLIKFWIDIMFGYPMEGLWMIWFIELYFFSGGLCPVFKQNSTKFSIDVHMFKVFWISCCHTGLGIRFSNEFWYQCMLCRFLGCAPRNWSPLKDKRSCHVFNLLVGVWKLYWYQSWRFLKYLFHCYKSNGYIVIRMSCILWFQFMNICLFL